MGGVSVNKPEDVPLDRTHWADVNYEDSEPELNTWIFPYDGRNRLHDISMAYGNEVPAEDIYRSPCLMVRIAAASDRV